MADEERMVSFGGMGDWDAFYGTVVVAPSGTPFLVAVAICMVISLYL